MEIECPVCTLFLRSGMNLAEHLDTHPKEKVISALVKSWLLTKNGPPSEVIEIGGGEELPPVVAPKTTTSTTVVLTDSPPGSSRPMSSGYEPAQSIYLDGAGSTSALLGNPPAMAAPIVVKTMNAYGVPGFQLNNVTFFKEPVPVAATVTITSSSSEEDFAAEPQPGTSSGRGATAGSTAAIYPRYTNELYSGPPPPYSRAVTSTVTTNTTHIVPVSQPQAMFQHSKATTISEPVSKPASYDGGETGFKTEQSFASGPATTSNTVSPTVSATSTVSTSPSSVNSTPPKANIVQVLSDVKLQSDIKDFQDIITHLNAGKMAIVGDKTTLIPHQSDQRGSSASAGGRSLLAFSSQRPSTQQVQGCIDPQQQQQQQQLAPVQKFEVPDVPHVCEEECEDYGETGVEWQEEEELDEDGVAGEEVQAAEQQIEQEQEEEEWQEMKFTPAVGEMESAAATPPKTSAMMTSVIQKTPQTPPAPPAASAPDASKMVKIVLSLPATTKSSTMANGQQSQPPQANNSTGGKQSRQSHGRFPTPKKLVIKPLQPVLQQHHQPAHQQQQQQQQFDLDATALSTLAEVVCTTAAQQQQQQQQQPGGESATAAVIQKTSPIKREAMRQAVGGEIRPYEIDVGAYNISYVGEAGETHYYPLPKNEEEIILVSDGGSGNGSDSDAQLVPVEAVLDDGSPDQLEELVLEERAEEMEVPMETIDVDAEEEEESKPIDIDEEYEEEEEEEEDEEEDMDEEDEEEEEEEDLEEEDDEDEDDEEEEEEDDEDGEEDEQGEEDGEGEQSERMGGVVGMRAPKVRSGSVPPYNERSGKQQQQQHAEYAASRANEGTVAPPKTLHGHTVARKRSVTMIDADDEDEKDGRHRYANTQASKIAQHVRTVPLEVTAMEGKDRDELEAGPSSSSSASGDANGPPRPKIRITSAPGSYWHGKQTPAASASGEEVAAPVTAKVERDDPVPSAGEGGTFVYEEDTSGASCSSAATFLRKRGVAIAVVTPSASATSVSTAGTGGVSGGEGEGTGAHEEAAAKASASCSQHSNSSSSMYSSNATVTTSSCSSAASLLMERAASTESLNIRTDEKMPAKGEISEQESNGDMDVTSWNQRLYAVGDNMPIYPSSYDLSTAQECWNLSSRTQSMFAGNNVQFYYTPPEQAQFGSGNSGQIPLTRVAFQFAATSTTLHQQQGGPHMQQQHQPLGIAPEQLPMGGIGIIATAGKIEPQQQDLALLEQHQQQQDNDIDTDTADMDETTRNRLMKSTLQNMIVQEDGAPQQQQEQEQEQQQSVLPMCETKYEETGHSSTASFFGLCDKVNVLMMAEGGGNGGSAVQRAQKPSGSGVSRTYRCAHCPKAFGSIKLRRVHQQSVHADEMRQMLMSFAASGAACGGGSEMVEAEAEAGAPSVALQPTTSSVKRLPPVLMNYEWMLQEVQRKSMVMKSTFMVMPSTSGAMEAVAGTSGTSGTTGGGELVVPVEQKPELVLARLPGAADGGGGPSGPFLGGAGRNRSYQCSTCLQQFERFNLFNEHLVEHPVTCGSCGRQFKQWRNFSLHVKRHLGIKEHECRTCGKQFVIKQKLIEHMRVHSGYAPIKCKQCNRSFKRFSNLAQHRKRNHQNRAAAKEDYVCQQCGEVFHSVAKMEWHKETHEKKPKACPYCREKFIHRNSLTRHIRLSHTDKYAQLEETRTEPCTICQQPYTKTSMRRHLETHTKERMAYACSICNKRFTTNWNLKQHKWTHANPTLKPFQCSHCPSAFVRESDYVTHVNAHRSIRPYTCNHCGCQFIRKYNWLRHSREHESDKGYRCDECGREFHRKYYLTEHQRMHTGERPFTCNICGKTSATKTNHNKHVRIHHARDPLTAEG